MDFMTGTGQKLVNVHDPNECHGRPCVIHHPSSHHMRDWPLHWREVGFLDVKPSHFERICPHGIGHPDPDDMKYWIQRDPGVGPSMAVHGCDGCCKMEEVDVNGKV